MRPHGNGPREERLGLLCQHFFPEMISTGLHMTELVSVLSHQGWRLKVYCAQPALVADDGGAAPSGTCDYEGASVCRVAARGVHRGGLVGRLMFAVSYTVGVAWRVFRDRKKLAGLIASTNPPFIGLVALVMRWLCGKPYSVIVYDVYPDIAVRLGMVRAESWIAKAWNLASKTILAKASLVVVIGSDMAAIVGSKLGERQVPTVVIPNWSNEAKVGLVASSENAFVRENGLQGRVIVQYAGTMGRTHNLEALIEAAKILRDNQTVVFQFVGDGAKRPLLEEMVRRERLTNVRFLPYQPVSELAAMLSAADLAVVALEHSFTGLSVPSKTYGIMACGVPILGILDPSSEIGRTIIEHRCGVVLGQADGRRIADVVQDLLAEPERFREMGRNGRRAFLEHYTLAKAGQRYDVALRSAFGDAACREQDEPKFSGELAKPAAELT